MAKYPLGGRPSKSALARIKVGTVVVSIAAFLGSLAGVAYLNPGINTAAAASQAQAAESTTLIASASQSTSSGRQAATQQQGIVFPAVRTRGS